MLPYDNNFLILVLEQACMIFATTCMAKISKLRGLCLLALIIRESRLQKTKKILRTRGSFRFSKGLYFGGPWD